MVMTNKQAKTKKDMEDLRFKPKDVIEFIPETGKYRKICPVCKKELIGRKNIVYHPKCKQKINNDKAAKRNSRIMNDAKVLRRNAEILEYFYSKNSSIDGIPLDKLKRKGFITKCPTIPFKYKDDVNTWFKIGTYAFRINNNTIYINQYK